MALPINILDLINRRVIESARIEYKGDWNHSEPEKVHSRNQKLCLAKENENG